ncbi:hypothetical protein GB931_00985 [Modestobacter sp. I12A-02628]|uniref:Uncharacterized protein n=1 Tax=Goekera deserti TaxID=2497753 RepID=A0A7K3WGC7_9ACTN|nr:hypothetical protein [Goekera deserti]MPQ96517.1 hypothetical protein [Goekera deserti]NDI47168.1 hypothetical protein [Goekera deserti]NEL55432.1 hypothetical protein [Goekera deserti]
MTQPTGGIRHPLNPRALYSPDEGGTVRVTMGRRCGRFSRDGRWLEGPLFEADPELCLWVSAPRPAGHHRLSRLVDAPAER